MRTQETKQDYVLFYILLQKFTDVSKLLARLRHLGDRPDEPGYTAQRPKDSHLYNHCRENLKSLLDTVGITQLHPNDVLY